jgi:hypothetical protein
VIQASTQIAYLLNWERRENAGMKLRSLHRNNPAVMGQIVLPFTPDPSPLNVKNAVQLLPDHMLT